MSTALKVTPEEMAVYRATARRRWGREQQALVQRRERAWELARQAARLLKAQFGATRVVVFGSLVHEGCFTPWSDVDIAAWGIMPEDTFPRHRSGDGLGGRHRSQPGTFSDTIASKAAERPAGFLPVRWADPVQDQAPVSHLQWLA